MPVSSFSNDNSQRYHAARSIEAWAIYCKVCFCAQNPSPTKRQVSSWMVTFVCTYLVIGSVFKRFCEQHGTPVVMIQEYHATKLLKDYLLSLSIKYVFDQSYHVLPFFSLQTEHHPEYLLRPLNPGEPVRKCVVIDLDETLVHSSFRVSKAMRIPLIATAHSTEWDTCIGHALALIHQ